MLDLITPSALQLITYLKDNKHHPLMCGDGANDVGALKQVSRRERRQKPPPLSNQADAGIALLSGFGSANVARPDEVAVSPEEKAKADLAACK